MKKLNLKKVTLQIENLESRDAPKTSTGNCDSMTGSSGGTITSNTSGTGYAEGLIAVVADV